MNRELESRLGSIALFLGWDVGKIAAHVSPYELLRQRAEGGTAILVDAARGTESVVLKIPRLDIDELFTSAKDVAEAIRYEGRFLSDAAAQPGLVALKGYHDHEDLPFLALEPLGSDLVSLTPEGGLSFRQCLEVARDTCRAFVGLHGRGLVHNDVSPANILEGPSGWTMIDPCPPEFLALPFTEEGKRGPVRDIVALGRTLLSVYSGYNISTASNQEEWDSEQNRSLERVETEQGSATRSYIEQMIGERWGWEDPEDTENWEEWTECEAYPQTASEVLEWAIDQLSEYGERPTGR